MQYRKLSELQKLEDNPRTITDKDFKILCESVEKNKDYFEARPLILSDRTGKLVIIGGNQRYEAAKTLGIEEVPTHLIENLTEKREKEIIVRDNINNGEFDFDILANQYELEDLDAWGIELPAGVGEEEVVEDEAPEVSKDPPLSVPGAVYSLGRHKLMCGDATKLDDVKTLVQEQKIDLVFTDPPYNVDYSGRGQNKLGTIKNDNMSADEFSGFLSEVFNNYSEVMKSGASIYVCHPDSVSEAKIAFEVRFNESFKKSSTIIWVKQSAGMGWQDYRVQHEPILYGWKGSNHTFFAGRDKTTIWNFSRDAQASYSHPTQKPVELSAEAIKNSSKGDDIVLDLFGGSGSTLIACEQLDRTCFMMELDPKYCDVIRKRYWKFVNDNNEEGWEDGTKAISSR